MKKTILFVTMMLISIEMAFASFGIDFSLGILSTLGVTYNHNRMEYDAKFNTTAGTGGLLANAFMDKITDADLSDKEKTEFGNKLIHGFSAGAFYSLADGNKFKFRLGPEITAYHVSCKKGVISHFEKGDLVLFNLTSKLDYCFNENNSIYFNIGFPLLAYINYGGDQESHNYMGFDFWTFIPTTIKQVDDGKWAEGLGKTLALAMFALNLRIGYTYRF